MPRELFREPREFGGGVRMAAKSARRTAAAAAGRTMTGQSLRRSRHWSRQRRGLGDRAGSVTAAAAFRTAWGAGVRRLGAPWGFVTDGWPARPASWEGEAARVGECPRVVVTRMAVRRARRGGGWAAGRRAPRAPRAPSAGERVFSCCRRVATLCSGDAGVIQLVECQLPKLDVAGSSPVARS